jgi:hypothetical protein
MRADAASISSSAIRRVAAVSGMRSNFSVYSMTAASPRARTSARIAATVAPTSSETSRLLPSKVSKSAAKVASRLLRR